MTRAILIVLTVLAGAAAGAAPSRGAAARTGRGGAR